MICPNCKAELTENQKYCTVCGQPVAMPAQNTEPANNNTSSAEYVNPQQGSYTPAYHQPPVYNRPAYTQPAPQSDYTPQYKPLSPWAYFGYTILFVLPVIGFILLLVFSFSDSNINRRNFARSYFCAFLIAIIVTIIIVVLSLVFGFSVADMVSEYADYYI